MIQIDEHIFSNGLVQPLTSFQFAKITRKLSEAVAFRYIGFFVFVPRHLVCTGLHLKPTQTTTF